MADFPTQTQQPPRVFYVVIYPSGGEESKHGPAPASKASIEAMPMIKVDRSSGNVDCSICLEEFKVDEEAREMPCKHVFHSGCVEKWLLIHGSCPVCRFLMPSEEAENRGGGNGGQGGIEEISLEFLQSVLALATFASFMAMAGSGQGSEQTGSDRSDDSDSSSPQDMDFD
ncbi:hypothetical protein PTKIN_Ptkin07bG0052700 [Pterospermum kingtungense]